MPRCNTYPSQSHCVPKWVVLAGEQTAWTPSHRQTRMCSMVVYRKVYYWIVPLLSVLFECGGLGDILYTRIPINAPVHRQTAQPVCYIKPRSFLWLFPPRKKSECKSWGIYKPIYAVLNFLIHLSQYVNNPFAHKSIFKALFENFQKKFISPAIFKPFLKTPSTLKVIIDYKSGWAWKSPVCVTPEAQCRWPSRSKIHWPFKYHIKLTPT